MSFLVSARKYRPPQFIDVVGQKAVTTTLKNAIKNNKLAQSFLFCGPRGVGKTTCARILAKVINCQNPTPNIEPCNTCDACSAFMHNASFNIFELDAASNNSVDDIRSLIEQVRFAPQTGKYKIYIIDEVHMLSTAAFNAFLKTLEEPPSYAIFILATTEKHKIIPTILSRCQIFDFQRITVTDMVEHLKYIANDQNITAQLDALHVIAQKADGALRDALSMFDRIASFANGAISYKDVIDTLHILDYDYYFKLTDALLSEDTANTMLILNEILYKGFDGENFLTGLSEHFRSLLVCKNQATLILLDVTDSIRQRYSQQATIAPSAFLLSALSIANQCEIAYKTSRNKRLQLELALLKMCCISSTIDSIQANQQQIAALKASGVEEKKNFNVTPSTKKNIEPTIYKGGYDQKEITTYLAESGKTIQLNLNDLHKNNGLLSANNKLSSEANNHTVNPLTISIIQEAWTRFGKQTSPTTQSIFTTISPNFQNNKVSVVVASNLQEVILKEVAGDFLTFLRTEVALPNLKIDFEIIVDKSQQETNKAQLGYMPEDKLKSFIEINPALNELIKKFNLNIY